MMAKVVYRERGIDARELAADDLKKAGVEGFTKTRFNKGEPVEVTDEVAEALVSGKLGKGFSIVSEEKAEEAEVDAKAAEADAPATESAQESVSAPRAPKTNRSSTP
jgi:hypothetical protein